jgi:hypothetical protein
MMGEGESLDALVTLPAWLCPGSVQFEWMEKVLTDPAHKNMNFILHGHIPPLGKCALPPKHVDKNAHAIANGNTAPPLNGDKVYFPTCLQRYYNFTSAHKDRIKGAPRSLFSSTEKNVLRAK